MQDRQTKNTVGWQMSGATPRTSSAGGWIFAPATVPVSLPTPPRLRIAAREQTVRRPLRFLPVLATVGVITTLIGGVAVARYPKNAARNATSACPVNIAVTVENGDTLWTLSKRYGNGSQYILDKVDEIAQVNNLSTKVALMPGQRVWIPAHDDAERTFITARRLTR